VRNWRWNGARWWKFDFHTHTPASEDYGKGPDQANHKRHTPREWLVGYMKAGIDCVAVTDHNTGEWIDQLRTVLTELEKEKPDGFRPIHLFPGVELSVNGGIHVLAIFSPEKTTSDIDTLLGAADFDGTKGTSDRVTKKSFSEVVDVIHAAGGITVPAHVDANHGLFQLTGTTLQQAFADLIAMEVVDPSCTRPQVYNERRRHLTEVLGSDSHHPSGNATQSYPGSHFSWVKMAEPSLEGLRLALLDGPLSVRRSDQVQGDLNAHAPLVMESIDVSHARYMGRSKPFRVELNPWLNAIIGGRGTGKSSLLEFLRIALRRERELPESVAGDFEKYGRVYENRRDEGLLTQKRRKVPHPMERTGRSQSYRG
jgi:predicted metal-dependent phosphoesterase TrpH